MSMMKMGGFTKGIVIDTDDPSGFHRIKVRIPQLHGTMTDLPYIDPKIRNIRVPDSELPWCEVCYPYGSTIPPEINQVVLIGFIDGASSIPVVLGWLGYDYTDQEDVYQVSNLSLV